MANVKLTPREALEASGRYYNWVAKQMGIDKSYLSRLVSGDRPWLEPLRYRFALAVGIPHEIINFAEGVHSNGTDPLSADNTPTPRNGA